MVNALKFSDFKEFYCKHSQQILIKYYIFLNVNVVEKITYL